MNICTYMDLSTAHITSNDNDILDDLSCDPSAYILVVDHGSGYWISVPDPDFEDDKLVSFEWFSNAGLSIAFFNIMNLAIEKGCRWINFDRDGFLCKDPYLPVFEW